MPDWLIGHTPLLGCSANHGEAEVSSRFLGRFHTLWMFWRERQRGRGLRGEVEHVIMVVCVCRSVRLRARAIWGVHVFFFLPARVSFCPASCFSDATSNFVSWATRGPYYVFFLISLSRTHSLFLSSQEKRTNCCAVAIGAGRFVFPPLSSMVPPRRQLP